MGLKNEALLRNFYSNDDIKKIAIKQQSSHSGSDHLFWGRGDRELRQLN